MAPITAARSTDGSGRASSTNPSSTSPAATSRARRPRPTPRAAASAMMQTIVTLVPLTAARCVRPVARMASPRSAGCSLVSPSTRPGSSPRGSAGSGAAA